MTTLIRTWIREQPSIIAASSNSVGIESKKPFSIQVQNGSENEV